MAKPDKPAADAPAETTSVAPVFVPPGLVPAGQPMDPNPYAAVVTTNVDGIVAHAPPGVHASLLGVLVHGHFAGKGWHVQHGTPVAGLPAHIVAEIVRNDPNALAPWNPPAPPVTG